MNIVLFALAWIILGIIALIMATRVAKKSIEELHNIKECTNDDITSTMAKEAETEQMEGSSFLFNMLKHPIITNVIAIIFWPVIIPLTLYGWNHYDEL